MNSIFTIAFIMLFFDFIYLRSVSNHFQELISSIQGRDLTVKIFPAFLCYLVMTLTIYYFLIVPKKSVIDAFFLGIAIYGVYDLTNMATIERWTWKTVLIDTLWGGILFASTVYLTNLIHSK